MPRTDPLRKTQFMHFMKLGIIWPSTQAIGIKQWSLLALTVALSFASVGCTATYNTRTVESPDWKYAVTCYIRGSFGRSYVAETKKRIVIGIYSLAPNAKLLREKEIQEALAARVWRSNPGAVSKSR